jgi:proteasome assembly chaperone (PAC2) family protein
VPELYRIHEAPELVDPVLIIGLDGWIDAGYAATNAVGTMLEGAGYVTVATFDTDVLLDHRSRRPTMHISDGVTTGLTWPTIELRAAADAEGGEALFLVGAEPDHLWRAFSSAVVDLAHEFGVSEVVSLGAYPAAVPHTRPVRVIATSTSMAAWMPAGTSTRPATVPMRLACSAEVDVAITRTGRVWGTAAG